MNKYKPGDDVWLWREDGLFVGATRHTVIATTNKYYEEQLWVDDHDYGVFTIDASKVFDSPQEVYRDRIAELQRQVAALEEEIEDCKERLDEWNE